MKSDSIYIEDSTGKIIICLVWKSYSFPDF